MWGTTSSAHSATQQVSFSAYATTDPPSLGRRPVQCAEAYIRGRTHGTHIPVGTALWRWCGSDATVPKTANRSTARMLTSAASAPAACPGHLVCRAADQLTHQDRRRAVTRASSPNSRSGRQRYEISTPRFLPRSSFTRYNPRSPRFPRGITRPCIAWLSALPKAPSRHAPSLVATTAICAAK